ncbi:MAG TPA: serine hydrolase domain-containing protein, partial [Chitinophagaceae bacterium]|nr:serine hydrolase domain-containing protein [Chitinophagaceae bacterium]
TTVPAKRDITFRDLLTHTSGIDYAAIGSPQMVAIYAKAGIPVGLGNPAENLVERMKALAGLPLVHQPGEKWTYSLGIDVAGALVEIISGTNLEDYLMQKIFRPLGMKDTYFNVPANKANRLATVYTEDSLQHIIPWGKTFRDIDPSYPLMKKHYFSGGAGLTSTAFDYAIFLQMMLNGGKYNGVQVLAPRTVQIMTSGQLDFMFNGMDNFGIGFEITSDKSAARMPRNAGSFSWGGYFGTTYWADPRAKMVCLIMTQQTPNSHGDLATKFEQLVYQSLE